MSWEAWATPIDSIEIEISSVSVSKSVSKSVSVSVSVSKSKSKSVSVSVSVSVSKSRVGAVREPPLPLFPNAAMHNAQARLSAYAPSKSKSKSKSIQFRFVPRFDSIPISIAMPTPIAIPIALPRVAPALVPVAEGQEVFHKKRGQPTTNRESTDRGLSFHWHKGAFRRSLLLRRHPRARRHNG
jgi:hypothetical protein